MEWIWEQSSIHTTLSRNGFAIRIFQKNNPRFNFQKMFRSVKWVCEDFETYFYTSDLSWLNFKIKNNYLWFQMISIS